MFLLQRHALFSIPDALKALLLIFGVRYPGRPLKSESCLGLRIALVSAVLGRRREPSVQKR